MRARGGPVLAVVVALLSAAPACDREGPASGGRSAHQRDVDRRVIQIVGKQTDVDVRELSRSTHLRKDLMYDDLDTVETTMELEDAFEITIPDEDADRWQTVGEMSDYVAARLNRPAPGGP